jgi:hypothetical protein
MGSEVLLFVEIQQLGRVFFELGVRGGGRVLEAPYGSGQESKYNYLLFSVDEDLAGVDPFFLDSSVTCFM